MGPQPYLALINTFPSLCFLFCRVGWKIGGQSFWIVSWSCTCILSIYLGVFLVIDDT